MSASKYFLDDRPAEILLHDLPILVEQDHETIAMILAHIGTIEAHRFYIPAAYPSMIAYCMGALRMTKDAALKRIGVARACRKFPAIFEAIAEDRITLTAVVLLKPHMTNENVVELLAAAEGKSKAEVERLVAMLKQPELATSVPTGSEVVSDPPQTMPTCSEVVPEPPQANVHTEEPPSVEVVPEPLMSTPPALAPTVPAPLAMRLSIDDEMQRLFVYAQELLSHRVSSGSPTEVVRRALKALIRELEREKFAATKSPRPLQNRSKTQTRYIPNHVRRAVRERDGFQCTYVSASGHRCESRRQLEFDHVREFALGGETTVDNIRLRCRVHNQYTAEQTFGAEFVQRKRVASP